MPLSTSRYFLFGILLGWICPAALGYQVNLDALVKDSKRQLQPTNPQVFEAKRIQAQQLCRSTVDRLSQNAVGYVLSLDLELPQLVDLLNSPAPDPQILETYERKLRRVVSGPDQLLIDDLRERIGEVRRLSAATDESVKDARQALDHLATLRSPTESRLITGEEDKRIRQSFETLQDSNLSPTLLASLQRTLSHPNVIIRVRKEAAKRESIVPFSIPVNADTCRDRTRVVASGTLHFETSACFPENWSSIPILAEVSGGGDIRADVSRSSSRISAIIHATGIGTQSLTLTPRAVERSEPEVRVRLSSQLQSIQLAGLLGRSHLARGVVSRIAQRKLAEQDPTLARQIEDKAGDKASEEGLKLANKVNSMLTSNFWSRLESIDFAPSVELASDLVYMRSSSLYALPEQLGALTLPTRLNHDLERRLEWCTFVHESAVNNLLTSLRGKTLDEATLRGVWQVQLKLTRDAWELPKVSHIPSTITFDSAKASELHFTDHTAELIVHLADGRISDRPPIGASCTARVRYRLNSSQAGIQIVRDEIEFTGAGTPDQQQAWSELIPLFLPDSVSPIPRFRPSLWNQYVSLEHVESQAGWLTLGLTFHSGLRDQFKSKTSSGASR